jgi:alpha(1,3/1,4) fucosyltransferase
VKIFNKIFSTKFLSYKGEVDEKKSVFQKYKFAVCYENVRDIPGYITEKIFDCFFSGCIPIYWGANNITDFIPGNCFIDKRNFTEFQCLYDYIKNITKAEYFNYINNIEKFLNSEQANIFRTEYFAKTIIDNIYFND